MIPILETREIQEKILADEAKILQDAFGLSDVTHKACIAEAIKQLEKVVC
jgi:hypothetical protein